MVEQRDRDVWCGRRIRGRQVGLLEKDRWDGSLDLGEGAAG